MSELPPTEKWEYILRSELRDLPPPTPELLFCPGRKFRADWGWITPRRVLVEIDGGQHLADGGRHNQDSDREKLNLAAALGFTVIRLTPGLLKDSTWVAQLIRAAVLGTDPPLTCRVVKQQVRKRRVKAKEKRADWERFCESGKPGGLFR